MIEFFDKKIFFKLLNQWWGLNHCPLNGFFFQKVIEMFLGIAIGSQNFRSPNLVTKGNKK
jgi:hypothetical protein